MFRRPLKSRKSTTCLPCTRRDVPLLVVAGVDHSWSALHTQGCSCRLYRMPGCLAVCPAHAGMSPLQEIADGQSVCLPCTRRDVPLAARCLPTLLLSPLHKQGCSGMRKRLEIVLPVCPARAGMLLSEVISAEQLNRIPCTRRDVPKRSEGALVERLCALHCLPCIRRVVPPATGKWINSVKSALRP